MARSLKINGRTHDVDAEDDTPLLWVVRDIVGLTGTKFGCGIAQCGACTVHVDGSARRSCITALGSIGDSSITTIENLSQDPVGRALQKAWIDLEVVQCGYCQAGQLMQAAALLSANATPSDEDIDAVMSGNICRCGTYPRIRAAIKRAAGDMAAAGKAA